MATPVADDLLMICWDAEKGAPAGWTGMSLPYALAGALIVDAINSGAAEVDDERVAATGSDPGDPLLESVLERVNKPRRPPKMSDLVGSVAWESPVDSVRDRLVERQILTEESDKILGLLPRRRHTPRDRSSFEAVGERTRNLLLGAVDPEQVPDHEVLAAVLTEPAGAVDVLFDDRAERKAAKQRLRNSAMTHRWLPRSATQLRMPRWR